jgi:hypothetical protein
VFGDNSGGVERGRSNGARPLIAGVSCLSVGGLRVITQPTTYRLNQPARDAWLLGSGWPARRAGRANAGDR